MKISRKEIDFFKKKGWVIIDTNLSDEEIKIYRNSIESIVKKAKKSNYPLGRKYFPHIRNQNIAAIEAPFNKLIINAEVKKLFKKIKLGNTLCNLLNWDKAYMYISRLFTMQYNYQGHWHRDIKFKDQFDSNNLKKIQCVVYLKNQPGFRILKKEYDIKGDKTNKINKDPENVSIGLDLPNNMFDVIPGKAGTILIFDTELLHQGYSTNERLDLFFLFSCSINKNMRTNNPSKKNLEFVKDDFFDFYSLHEYSENFNPLDSIDAPFLKNEEKNFRAKYINSINYYLPLKNLINGLNYNLKNRNNLFKANFFANTFFQKRYD